MTTKQKHTRLKNLAKDTKSHLYEMCRLASEILQDHEYVDALGGEDVVLEMLETSEFSHFGGSPGVLQLVQAYRANPAKKTWEEHRFNVWAMIDLANPPAAKEAVERVSWKSIAAEREAEIERLTAEVARLEAEIERLTAEVALVSEENALLRGEVRALTRRAVA